jgi:branched-chain amino acid transport system permease protein
LGGRFFTRGKSNGRITSSIIKRPGQRIALGLTIIFGTLGVVNFAHGALFMLGAFCAVSMQALLDVSFETISATKKDFLGNTLVEETPYVVHWFGDFGHSLIEYSVPVSILMAISVMLVIGIVME